MEKLIGKVSKNMVKRAVNEKQVEMAQFKTAFKNYKFHTDGIELHLLNGRALVKIGATPERELTEAEYQEMLECVYEGTVFKDEFREWPITEIAKLSNIEVKPKVRKGLDTLKSEYEEDVSNEVKLLISNSSVESLPLASSDEEMGQLSLF